MADVQQTYKFKFEFDRKDVKKQLKEISVDVKDAIAQIGDASDKVVIFKELVSYLSNIDKALDAFKTKHKDDFSNLFGNPDKEILGVLTEIFNTTQQSAQAFATLKDKISAAESGKAELSTLRSIAEEINALFVSINKTPKIDINEMFSGKGSKAKGTDFAGRIKLLNDTLDEFGITYSGFQNKLKGGFGFGGTGGSSISKEMQKEIDALNKQKSELQEIIDAIDGKDIKINISVKDDAKQIKNLLEEYKKINSKTTSNEFKDLSLNEQNKLLSEQLRLATLLKNARDHINKKGGSDEAFDLVNTGEGMRIIDNIEKSLDGHRLEIQKKADQIKNIYADLIANIDVKLNQLSIDNLNMEPTRQSITSAIELMQEANRIIGEISYDSQNYDLLDAQLDSIIDKIKQLAVSEEQVEQLDELLEVNRDAPEDVLDELCTILEVDIPRAAEKARDAIDGIAGGQNSPSKQNISILAKQLQEIYNISRQIGDNEIGFAVDIDGSAYFVQSADHIVKVADEASVAVRALNENLTILGHTHPSGGGLFSAGDYRSAISQKRSGMNMPVVAVGSNAASLLNLDGVDETTLDQIERVLDRFKNSDDAVGPSVVKELQNILSSNGFTDALQVVDISNGMDDLSEALLKLSLNATEVQTPLQKLQSLIQYYSGNKLGANNISQFADEWKEFESGVKSAAEVFDSVMHKLDATDLEGNYFNTSEKKYENLSTSLNMIKPSADTAGNAIEYKQEQSVIEENNQKLREQEQLWENVKIAIKNGIGEAVGIDSLAETLELIEREIKEGILTSIEECIARFKEWNNISEEESLTFIGERERIIDEHNYGTYLLGSDEVVDKEEEDKLRQLSVQREQLYQNLRSAIKGTLSDIVDVDDMTYAFDTIEKEIEAGLLTTLDQCIEKFKLLTGLDDERLTSIRDDQRVADSWDYYRGNQYVDDSETVINSSEYNKFLNERVELLERISSLQSKVNGMPDTYFTEGEFESSVQEYCVEIDRLQNELAELKISYDVLKDAHQFSTEDIVDYEREIVDLNKIIEDLQTKLSSKTGETGTGVGGSNTIGDNSLIVSSEISQLELLQQKLLEVKSTIDAKTQAFEEEYITVDGVVEAEIAALQELSNKLDGIITKVGLVEASIKNIGSNSIQLNVKETADIPDGTVRTPDEQFKIDKTAQKGALTKYLDSLKDVDYIAGDLRKKLNDLPDLLDITATPENLNKFKEILADVRKEVDATRRGFEEREGRGISSRKNALYTSFNALNVDQQKKLKDDFDAAINKLQEYEAQIKTGKKVELDALEAAIKGIREKIEAQAELNKAVKDAEKTQKKNAKFGDTTMVNAQSKYNSLNQIVHSDQFNKSSLVMKSWEDYEKSYKNLQEIRDRLAKKESITGDDEAEFRAAKEACNEYAKSLNKILNNSIKLSTEKANKNPYTLGDDFDYDNIESRKDALADFVKAEYDVVLGTENFKKGFKEAMFEVDNGDGTMTKMTAKFTDARNEIVAMAGDAKKVKSTFSGFIDGVLNRIKSLSQFFIATISVYDAWNVIKKGIGYVKEIDGALTELKKVTDETDASYNQFLQDMSKTGAVIGATVKDLTTMAAEWSRLGYSMEEAGKLAESTAILLNVSEFKDATTASEALISTMQAFQYTADESQHVVDVLNEVGNNYAVSSDGIATALQDSASALMEGGNNLEQAVALVAAANRVVQDPNSVGSALRTISLRLRGTSVEVLEEMGEETDNVIESTSKLQSKIKALSGVNILTDAGEYKDTYTILKEIGTVWKEMSDIDQAALLELMAGKNRANTLSAILSNMKDLEGAYNDALKAEGSALKENQTYLDSIQGRIDLFNNSLQTMWMNLLDTSFIKGFVDAGTGLIKFLDSSEGRFTALSAAVAVLGKVLKIGPTFSVVNDQLQILGKTTDTIRNNFTQLSAESTNWFDKTIGAGFKSIFGADLGKIDLSDMLSEDDFNNKINGIVSGFNGINQSIQKIEWNDFVDGQTDIDDATKTTLKTFELQNGQVIANSNAYKTYTGACATAAVGNNAVDVTVKKTTASLIAQKVAALAANAALTMGLSLLISLGVKLVSTWANADEAAAEAARSAADASQEIREQADSLEDYKEQIIELRKELDSNSLSETEAYDVREKLLTIQNELINKYELEKDGINLVTGAINNQIAAIDDLTRKKADQWLQNKQSSINDAIDFFESDTQGGGLDNWYEWFGGSAINMWGQTYDVISMIRNYALDHDNIHTDIGEIFGNQTIGFTGSVEEVKTAVEDFQKWLGSKETEMQSELSGLLEIDDPDNETQKKIKSLTANLKDIKDIREDIGKEHENWFGDDSIYAANKRVLEEAQYNTALTKYASEYGDILQAQKDLTEAQAKGDKDGIKKAIDTINSETEAAASKAETNGQNYMVNFFNGIQSEYEKQSKAIQFELDIENNQNVMSKILSGFNDMNAKEILQLKDIELVGDFAQYKSSWDALNRVAGQYGLTIDEIVNSLVNLGYVQSDFNNNVSGTTYVISSIDTLTSTVEKYKSTLETVNSITFDGQAISKDYYDELKEQLSDVTVGAEEFSDAIKEQNGKYIVKNVALLKKLVNQSKKARKATIEVARSQAQLQYRDIVDQMRNAITIMGVEYEAYNFITDATFDNISAMREQIDTLKQTIQQYALLEVSLSDAASAYDEYESAKERDAQLSYDESFSEMLKAIDEGLLKNETGSEAFEYSVRAVVPEVVWSGIEDPNEKVKAIHDYIDGDKTFSKLFHVDEESGELDVNTDNVREFIKLSKEAGMIVGGPEGFELDKTVYGTKEWAEALNITEAAVLALLSATEDCDALWGNILTDVMTHPLDREINKSVDEVDEATKKLEDYLKLVQETNSDEDKTNDVEFDSEYYSQLVSDIGAATDKLDENRQAALNNAQAYNTVQAVISSFRGDLTLTDGEATNLVNSLKEIEGLENLGEVVIEDGQLKLTDEQLTLILGKLGKITEPSVVQIQLRYDEISEEIDQINEYIKKGSTGSITIDGVVFTNGADADGNAIEDYLAKLTAEQKEIQLTYSITETSTEEEKSVLESYQEMAKNGVQFTVTADVTQATDSLSDVSNEQGKIKENQIITITAYASTAEQALKDVVDQLDKINSKEITITVNKVETTTGEDGSVGALGNAFAYGTIGLKQSEHNSVVGELGPEMVVDPIRGRYYTVGDHGTEMIDLPRGAIIYNHKQTKELLKHGRTSRGHYTGGLSFARGNAYADYGIPSYHPNLKDETSFKNGTDINTTWDDAVSTLNSAANKISDAMSDAADSVGEFEETIDWIEIRMEEFDERIGKLSAELENLTTAAEKNAKIDEIVIENQKKYADSLAGAKYYEEYAQKYLAGMNSTLVEAAKNGAIAITEFTKEQDEATVEAIQNYRDYAQKAADLHQQAEEIITEIADLAKQAFDNIVNEFDNKISLNDSKLDRFESENSLLETDKGWASEDIYANMQKENAAKIEILKQQRDAMQAELDTGKIKKGTDAWYEAVNAIAEVDTEIVNLNTEIEDLQDSINDLNWEQFEFLITQFQAVSDEAENLLDILSTKDAVDEFGNWTDEGITSLGLLAQQMEVAEKQASKYEAAIEHLNENWEKLGYTQEEYIERLEELKSGQYDAIKSYNDAKESIRDLNKVRVDAIKDGIEKEIDAYEELIKTKKEALDAEKDLHDFQKNVADQQKNITDIQRKLAALSGDNSASARAQRAKLEAELYEAQADLEETYYDRSVSNQQDALDKELESFQDQKEAEIEGWEKYLENLEVVVADSLAVVQENTNAVLATLTSMQDQYGLTITNSLITPWKAGEIAIQEYGAKLNMSLTELAAMFGLTVDEFAAKLGLTTEQLVSNLNITVAHMAENLGLTEAQLAEKLGITVDDLNGKMDMSIQQFAASIGLTLPSLAEKLGTTMAGLAGNLEMTMTQFAGKMGLTVDGLAGKFGLSVEGLAKKLGIAYEDLLNPFGLSMSATVDELTKLETKYKAILDSIVEDSKNTVKEVNDSINRYQTPKKAPSTSDKKEDTKNDNNTKKEQTSSKTEKDYYGVALAIWNGNYGWGDGTTRVKNLTAKGFDANKVQEIINKMDKEGYIHSGLWRGKYHGITDISKYHINKFAKGTTGVEKDQLALIDELGSELVFHAQNGKLAFLTKGSAVIPHDISENLMALGSIDPQDMLDRNRPAISTPHIVNNEINVSLEVAELVHIDHVDHDTLPDLTKAVRKEMDSYMSKVNNAIRSKVR